MLETCRCLNKEISKESLLFAGVHPVLLHDLAFCSIVGGIMAWRSKRDGCDQLTVHRAVEIPPAFWCWPTSVSGEAAALRSGRIAKLEE